MSFSAVRKLPIDTYPVSASQRIFFILIAIFTLVSPLSVSGVAADDPTQKLKWFRVLLLAFSMLMGLQWFRMPKANEFSFCVLVFSVVFCAAAVWSEVPVSGLLFKSMFVGAVISSIALARSLTGISAVRCFQRVFTFTACVGCCLVAAAILITDDYRIFNGRLVVSSINANTLGFSASLYALMSGAHFFTKDSTLWRFLALISATVMTGLVVWSGSRAAALLIVLGLASTVLLITDPGKRFLVIFFCALVTFLVFVVFNDDTKNRRLEVESSDGGLQLRLVEEFAKNTRSGIWVSTWERFSAKPILGEGWAQYRGKWSLVQSAYLQVIIECGLIGVALIVYFFVGLRKIVFQSIKALRSAKGMRHFLIAGSLVGLIGIVTHGFFESAMIAGATPNCILLGFFAAMLDILLRKRSAISSVQVR